MNKMHEQFNALLDALCLSAHEKEFNIETGRYKYNQEAFELFCTQMGCPQDPDSLYTQAVAEVRKSGRVSCSSIQRSLRCGYAAAVTLVERMEKQGVVSPIDKLGNRIVYV